MKVQRIDAASPSELSDGALVFLPAGTKRRVRGTTPGLLNIALPRVRLASLAALASLAMAVGMGLATTAALAVAATVVVRPNGMDGWAFNTADNTGTPPAVDGTTGTGLVLGPAVPPLGSGSALLFTGNATIGGDESAQLRNTGFATVKLSDLTSLSYCTYDTLNNGQQFPYLTLGIDSTGTGAATDDALFFEPPYQEPSTGNACLPDQGPTALNTWQCWDAFSGGWWANTGGGSGTIGCTEGSTGPLMCPYVPGSNPASGVCSLADYIAQHPNARILNRTDGLGGVRLSVGFASPTDQFNGNIDKFTIGVSGSATTYDFETCAVTANLYVSTTGSDVSNTCGDSSAPCLTIQHAIDVACNGDTINVAAGTYVETVTAGHGSASGAPGIDIDKAVVLKGAGAASTTIQANGGHFLPTSGGAGPLQAVTLSISGITIDGFTILETGATVNLITADGPADSNNHTIKNNIIVNPTFDDGNAGGGWGILLGLGDSANNTFTNNDISLNPDLTKNQFSFGIWDGNGGAVASSNNNFSGNTIHNVGIGIILDPGTGNVVSGNHFLDNAKAGVVDFGDSGTQITLNSFQNNRRSGVEVRNGSKNVVITGNCFQNNGTQALTFAPCGSGCSITPFGGIRIDDDGTPGATTGTQIHNNNFAGNAPNAVTDVTSASTNTDQAAENNWWGCATGANGGGTCQTVTANVDATPFLSAPSATPPCSCTANAQCPVDSNACTDDICAAAVDLAEGKTATQSSNLSGFDVCGTPPFASRAADGNTDGTYNNCSVSITETESQPWWEVDLGSSQNIGSIAVWNRTDAGADRLTNFHVLVSNNAALLAAGNLASAQALADHDFFVPGQGGSPTTILVNFTERYVRVQLAGSNYLQLAEVQVFLAGGCTHINNTAACDDSLFCNGTDTCSAGACTVHTGDPCPGTVCNTCQEATDSCFDASGAVCTTDGNICTDDTCDGAGTCAHPNNMAPCNDTLVCNGADTCSGGTCSAHDHPCVPTTTGGVDQNSTGVMGVGQPNCTINIFTCTDTVCFDGNDALIGTGSSNALGNFTITLSTPLVCQERIYAQQICPLADPVFGPVSVVKCFPAAPLLSPQTILFLVASLGLVGAFGLRRALPQP